MTTIGNESRPAYVYDAETDTWVPIGVGPHTHDEYIDKTIITAKGDIIVGTALEAVAKLGAGTTGQFLTVDPTAPTGLSWTSNLVNPLSVTGDVTSTRLRLTSTTDASLSSTDHALQVGPTAGINLIIDNNEIMGRNNGGNSAIFLNPDGGSVTVGGSGSAVSVPAGATLTLGTALAVGSGGTGATTLTSGGYLKGAGTSAVTSQTGVPAADVTGAVAVGNGGTGATTLTSGGYLKGAGTSAVTSQTGIPAGDITSGTLGIARGGTGATTLTSGGYLKGAGTSAITSQSGIPAGDITSGTISAARLPTNLGGMVLILSQNIGSNVGSVVVSNVFSSTYRNYQIEILGTNSLAGSSKIMQFNNSGGNNYHYGGAWWIYSGAQTSTGADPTNIALVGLGGTNNTTNITVQVYNPFLTQRTSYVSHGANDNYHFIFGGGDKNAVSNTGFTLTTSSTYSGGVVKVYGMRNTV
jgi:hypothetical protein